MMVCSTKPDSAPARTTALFFSPQSSKPFLPRQQARHALDRLDLAGRQHRQALVAAVAEPLLAVGAVAVPRRIVQLFRPGDVVAAEVVLAENQMVRGPPDDEVLLLVRLDALGIQVALDPVRHRAVGEDATQAGRRDRRPGADVGAMVSRHRDTRINARLADRRAIPANDLHRRAFLIARASA
jgi:hypothetical protein